MMPLGCGHSMLSPTGAGIASADAVPKGRQGVAERDIGWLVELLLPKSIYKTDRIGASARRT
jgi:hypothetical protein